MPPSYECIRELDWQHAPIQSPLLLAYSSLTKGTDIRIAFARAIRWRICVRPTFHRWRPFALETQANSCLAGHGYVLACMKLACFSTIVLASPSAAEVAICLEQIAERAQMYQLRYNSCDRALIVPAGFSYLSARSRQQPFPEWRAAIHQHTWRSDPELTPVQHLSQWTKLVFGASHQVARYL